MRPYRPIGSPGHVHEAAIVPLERHGHGRRRAVPVLGHDQVSLPRPRRLFLISVLAVQKDHNVRVLLNAVVADKAVGDKVMRTLYCCVIDRSLSQWLDTYDPVPVDVAASDLAERLGVEHIGTSH